MLSFTLVNYSPLNDTADTTCPNTMNIKTNYTADTSGQVLCFFSRSSAICLHLYYKKATMEG